MCVVLTRNKYYLKIKCPIYVVNIIPHSCVSPRAKKERKKIKLKSNRHVESEILSTEPIRTKKTLMLRKVKIGLF